MNIKNENAIPTVSIDYWSDFAKLLVELASLKPGGDILDIGTGSGACLTAVLEKLGTNCRLFGIDKDGSRLTKTSDVFNKNAIQNANFQIMDANKLKFENNSFDNIISGFMGFDDVFDFETNRFISNNTKMKEIYRVLKPGGEAAFSTWAYQQDLEAARDLVQNYLKITNTKKPYEIENLPISYSKESINGYNLMMADAGFSKIRILLKKFQIRYKSIDDWWNMMIRVAWVMSYALNNNPNELENLKNKLLPHGIDRYKKDSTYVFQKYVIFAFGQK